MSKKNTLVFFGSGPVAAESLALLSAKFDIEAVITKPTTKAEMIAVAGGVTVLTASNREELDELIVSSNFSSSVGVLIDFGIIVSQDTIDSFDKGIINSHFSLLPELRGADPITFSILEGKSETGVSLMMLVVAMDEGPVISQGSINLTGTHTAAKLTDDLIRLSNELLITNILPYLNGVINPKEQLYWQEQNGKSISYTRKITKHDGLIDWGKSAQDIEKEIRAYIDWPKSYITLGDVEVIVTSAHAEDSSGSTAPPGTITVENKQLQIQCAEGLLAIDNIKPAGKKNMNVQSFLAGYGSRLKI